MAGRIRAFTTAAFAFAAGAHDIIPINTVQEALALRERFPDALVMGCDTDRFPPQGFDFGNSPAALIGWDFCGTNPSGCNIPLGDFS